MHERDERMVASRKPVPLGIFGGRLVYFWTADRSAVYQLRVHLDGTADPVRWAQCLRLAGQGAIVECSGPHGMTNVMLSRNRVAGDGRCVVVPCILFTE